MRIVSATGPAGISFSRITDVAVDNAGFVYLVEEGHGLIAQYSGAGVFQRTFGRRGHGPGEFAQVFDLAAVVGDSIVVRDQNKWGFTFFSRVGRYLRTRSTDWRFQTVHSYLGDDKVLISQDYVTAIGPGRRTRFDSSQYAVIDGRANVVAKVTAASIDRPEMLRVALDSTADFPRFAMYYAQPFGAHVLTPGDPAGRLGFVVLPHQHWGGSPAQIRILSVTAKGDLASRTITLEARRAAESDFRSWAKEKSNDLADGARARGMSIAGLEARLRQAMVTPEFLPVAQEVLVGTDGSMWVRPSWSGNEWSVVVAGGTTASFRVQLPPGAQLMQVTADHCWAVLSDRDGVPFVVRFRVA